MVGAQCQNDHIVSLDFGFLFLESFHRMQDTGGIVHHAVGIDRDGEMLFGKPLSDTVGEAGAHKEHAGCGGYLPLRFFYFYCRSEKHWLLFI